MSQITIAKDLKAFFESKLDTLTVKQSLSCSPLTKKYLANLLNRFALLEHYLPEFEANKRNLPAIGLELLKSSELDAFERLNHLQNLGDYTLFTSGFFSDRIKSSSMDMDYYCAIGEKAYNKVGSLKSSISAEENLNVFFELASKFPDFVELLNEISDETKLSDPQNTLKVYEQWLGNGSKRLERMLQEKGIINTPKKGVS